MKTRFIILLITVCKGVVFPVFAEVEKSGEISASEVVIPAYDEDGRIAWELRASEVTRLERIATLPRIRYWKFFPRTRLLTWRSRIREYSI